MIPKINKKVAIIVVVVMLAILGIIAFSIFGGTETQTTEITESAETAEETTEITEETAVDAGKFSEIVEEMSKSDVVDLVGEPADKQTITTPKGNTVEYWYYETDDGVYQVGFDSVGVSVVRKY